MAASKSSLVFSPFVPWTVVAGLISDQYGLMAAFYFLAAQMVQRAA